MKTPKTEVLLIGEVATRAGVNIQTLRYYEKRGILGRPQRTRAGYRKYPMETVRIIRFIKRAQDLGFTLDEIEDLLRLRTMKGIAKNKVRDLARAKVEQIDEKVRKLVAMRGALDSLVSTCTCDLGKVECPILEALEDQTEEGADALH